MFTSVQFVRSYVRTYRITVTSIFQHFRLNYNSLFTGVSSAIAHVLYVQCKEMVGNYPKNAVKTRKLPERQGNVM